MDVVSQIFKDYDEIAGKDDAYTEALLKEVLQDERVMKLLLSVKEYDIGTYKHSLRAFYVAASLGEEMLEDAVRNKLLATTALLHDVGKLKIKKFILTKRGRLSKKEWEEMRMHPEYSYRILIQLGMPGEIAIGALQHHERCDGSGYPDHLTGYAISEIGRITAVFDIFSAVTETRPYNNALPPLKACTLIQSTEGLDLNVVKELVELCKRRELR